MVEIGLFAEEGHWGAAHAGGASRALSTACHAALLQLQK